MCENTADFEDSLGDALSTSKTQNIPLFLLFTGAKNPSTGVSWCPDCVAADPIIDKHLKSLPGAILLECPVLREEYRGNSEYAYRKHPIFKLACVPTLIKLGHDGKIKYRLNDAQSQDDDLVSELVNGV